MKERKFSHENGVTSFVEEIDLPDPPIPTKAEAKTELTAFVNRYVSDTYSQAEADAIVAAAP